MQTTPLIPLGTTLITSAAVVLSDGEAATLNFVGHGKVMLVSVDDVGTEIDIEVLSSSKARLVSVVGPIRFKVRRDACDQQVGVTMFKG